MGGRGRLLRGGAGRQHRTQHQGADQQASGEETVPQEKVRVAMLPLGESRIELLRSKIERLAEMVGEAEARRGRLIAALAELDANVKVEGI